VIDLSAPDILRSYRSDSNRRHGVHFFGVWCPPNANSISGNDAVEFIDFVANSVNLVYS
jgi:hypothetical protein